jgi:hypothetical protein
LLVQIEALVGPHLVENGTVTKADTPFVKGCIDLMSNALEMVNTADQELLRLVTYPLAETVASGAADGLIADNFKTVAEYVLAKYDDGSLQQVRPPGCYPSCYCALRNDLQQTAMCLKLPRLWQQCTPHDRLQAHTLVH